MLHYAPAFEVLKAVKRVNIWGVHRFSDLMGRVLDASVEDEEAVDTGDDVGEIKDSVEERLHVVHVELDKGLNWNRLISLLNRFLAAQRHPLLTD